MQRSEIPVRCSLWLGVAAEYRGEEGPKRPSHPAPLLGRTSPLSHLINDRPIAGFWDGLATGVSGLQPCLLGSQDLLQSLFGGLAKRRTRLEVRDVRNVPFVVFAIEHVDMIIFHAPSSMARL